MHTSAAPHKDWNRFDITDGRVIWRIDPDATPLCRHCNQPLVMNFERKGQWGHADTADTTCR